MKLGDLEFKAEDFLSVDGNNLTLTELLGRIATHANRLLRERLEKTPKWYGTSSQRAPDGTLERPVMWTTDARPGFDTHTARLVCIEEIK
jgi:hypothetical protein